MPVPQAFSTASVPWEGDCPQLVRRRSGGEPGTGNAAAEAPGIVHEVLNSQGQPLDAADRSFFEPRFDWDFSQIRIHADEQASASAGAVGALAYTVGTHIAFGLGQYAPGTPAGRRLLAHELAHTVQQGGAATRLFRQEAPGGAAAPSQRPGNRIVYLDTDVLSQVAGGNKQAAEALQAMLGSGADVRVARPNYNEALRGRAEHVGARKLIVEQLKIKIDEGAGLPSRMSTYEKYAEKSIKIQEKDLPMMAAARSGGGEIFSLDGGVKASAKQFGVQLAPESNIPSLKTPLNVRAGLDNVGLHDWIITVDGTPVRRPPSGGAPPSGWPPPSGGAPPSPAAPASPAPSGAPRGAQSASEEAVPRIPAGSMEAPGPVPARARSLKVPSAASGGVEIEPEVPPGGRSASGSGLAGFQIGLMAIQLFTPDPEEQANQEAIQARLNQKLHDPKSQAQLAKLQPIVNQTSEGVYYQIKYKVYFSAAKSWQRAEAREHYTVEDVEILDIRTGKEKVESSEELNPPHMPAEAHSVVPGGNLMWKATRVSTTSILPVRPEIGPTYGLQEPTKIRDAVAAADGETVAQIPVVEKVRILNRLFDHWWVGDEDIGAIKRIYANTPPDQKAEVRRVVEHRIPDLHSIGQRTQLRVMLAEP
jgi:hypothetical protein